MILLKKDTLKKHPEVRCGWIDSLWFPAGAGGHGGTLNPMSLISEVKFLIKH